MNQTQSPLDSGLMWARAFKLQLCFKTSYYKDLMEKCQCVYVHLVIHHSHLNFTEKKDKLH